MINKETIISVFDNKLTLMQWLKKVEEALNGAVLTNVELKKKGNATFAWSFVFEDGTHVDTEYVTINEGESVAEAYLLNGHLMIKLTNEEVIDAGNLKPVTSFSFNSQRHLIVSYGDGTTQDLGLIKGVSSFTIDTNQHLIVNYDNGTTQDLGSFGNFENVDFIAKTLKATNANWKSNNLVIYPTYGSIENIYTRVEEINNVLYIVSNFKIKNETENPITLQSGAPYVAYFSALNIPSNISDNIYDLNGHKVSETTDECLITSCEVEARRNTTREATSIDGIKLNILNSSGANAINFFMKVKENIVIESGQSIVCSIRTFLTLL